MRVLIADDDGVSRKMLESVLPMWGYEVVSASNGSDAWKILQQPDPPRLAILDWIMPEVDGIELIRRLRQQPGVRYVYALLLTARDAQCDLIAGLEAGADDYLTKPFDPNELRGRLFGARRALTAHDQMESLARELARKNHRLEELTETAHRFVDNVSHEFRTPLTVIKEFTSIIADGLAGEVTSSQQEYLQTITNAVHDLTQMVSDLLDSSKLKAGTLRVDRRRHDLAPILDKATVLVANKAAAKSIRIESELPADLAPVFADSEKVVRIVVNLLVNAIKFSPERSTVTLSASPTRDGDVSIRISDEGPGLSAEACARIFERFQQEQEAQDNSTAGFGLGLNIVRELAWLNLGTPAVTSVRGTGSTFSFTLPRHDRDRIIELFFARLADAGTERDRFAVLRIASNRPESDPETIRGFVTSSCYPTDLVLPLGDSEFLVAGMTDSPEGWTNRLDRLRKRAIENTPTDSLDGVDASCLGTWTLPDERDAARAAVLDLCRAEPAHG